MSQCVEKQVKGLLSLILDFHRNQENQTSRGFSPGMKMTPERLFNWIQTGEVSACERQEIESGSSCSEPRSMTVKPGKFHDSVPDK